MHLLLHHGSGLKLNVLQDYCGLLSEEAVRKNFVLVYELLDEVVDYGYPQNSSSEALKEFVLNEPTVLKPSVSKAPDFMQSYFLQLSASPFLPMA